MGILAIKHTGFFRFWLNLAGLMIKGKLYDVNWLNYFTRFHGHCSGILFFILLTCKNHVNLSSARIEDERWRCVDKVSKHKSALESVEWSRKSPAKIIWKNTALGAILSSIIPLTNEACTACCWQNFDSLPTDYSFGLVEEKNYWTGQRANKTVVD